MDHSCTSHELGMKEKRRKPWPRLEGRLKKWCEREEKKGRFRMRKGGDLMNALESLISSWQKGRAWDLVHRQRDNSKLIIDPWRVLNFYSLNMQFAYPPLDFGSGHVSRIGGKTQGIRKRQSHRMRGARARTHPSILFSHRFVFLFYLFVYLFIITLIVCLFLSL